MARYIDADLAQNTIKKLCDDYKISYGEKYGGFGGKISNIMENIPTADVQKVVRCKDCVYAQERYGHLECINGISYRNSWNKPDDFCSYGERKEESK